MYFSWNRGVPAPIQSWMLFIAIYHTGAQCTKTISFTRLCTRSPPLYSLRRSVLLTWVASMDTNVNVVTKFFKRNSRKASFGEGANSSGWNFKELLRNQLSLTRGWPEVLSMAPIIQVLDMWAWPELFSLSQLCIFLVMAKLMRVSFLLTNRIQPSVLWYITKTRIGTRPKGLPQVTGPQVKYTYTKCLKIPSPDNMINDDICTMVSLAFVDARIPPSLTRTLGGGKWKIDITSHKPGQAA